MGLHSTEKGIWLLVVAKGLSEFRNVLSHAQSYRDNWKCSTYRRFHGAVCLAVQLIRWRGRVIPIFVIIIAVALVFYGGRFDLTDNSPLARLDHSAAAARWQRASGGRF